MKEYQSIKTTFILVMILIVTAIFTLQSGFSLYQYKISTDKAVKTMLHLRIEGESDIISMKFLQIGEVVKSTADISALPNIDAYTMFTILKQDTMLEPLVFGTGIWFEPYQYDTKKKYYGPYYLRDKFGNVKFSWRYNTPQYDYFSWDWYKIGFRPNIKIAQSEPYYDPLSNLHMISLVSPIKRNNKVIGVVTADIDINKLDDYVSKIKVGKKGYAFMVTREGYYLGYKYPEKNLKEKIIGDKNLKIRSIGEKIVKASHTEISRVLWSGEDVFVVYSPIKEAGLKMVLVYPVAEAYEFFNKVLILSIITFLFAILLISIVIPIIFSRKISAPLALLIEKMKSVAGGDLEVESSRIQTNDEIGELSTAFNVMTDNLKNYIQREKLLREIILASVSSFDIKDVLNTIVTRTGKLFNSDRCFFIPYDAQTGEYSEIEEVYILSSDELSVEGVKLTQAQMAPFEKEFKQSYSQDNTDNSEIPEETKKIFDKYGTKSFMSVPIFYGDLLFGILVCDYTKDFKKFDQNDFDLMNAIGNQSAIVLKQAQLFKEVQDAKYKESLLKRITDKILASDNLETALYDFCSDLGTLFDVDRVSFRLFDPNLKTFTKVLGEYRKDESIPSAKTSIIISKELDKFLYEEIFLKKDLFILKDIEKESLSPMVKKIWKEIKVKSLIALPVMYKDVLLGILFLSTVHERIHFEKINFNLLLPLIQQISLGINLLMINEKLLKSLTTEKLIKEIVNIVRQSETHDQIFDQLLNNIMKLFDVDRVMHLHQRPEGNVIVNIEKTKTPELQSLKDKIIFNIEQFKTLFIKIFEKVFIINNVEADIRDAELSEFLKANGIRSFLLYSAENIYYNSNIKILNPLGSIIMCYSSARKWTSEEIELFKLIVDATALVYCEIKQKAETEQVKQTFLATLTHDLRSPINAEQKALEFILSRSLETPLADFFEFLEDIYKTNEELLRIVNNILSVSHYETGKFRLILEESNITDIISKSVKSMTPLARDQESEITVNVEDLLPLAWVDQNEIIRVITNLINNAIKHNKKGTDILVSAVKKDNKIQISVSDNGKGILEAEKSKIFQRYPTEKRKIGSGLGLYLSKQIIEAHNGEIWFTSEIDKGTTFYFTVPICNQTHS